MNDELFPKPDCLNCGNSDSVGGCRLTTGECLHLYKPSTLEHVFVPIAFHRETMSMEYERFTNTPNVNIPKNDGKLNLTSNMLYTIFHDDTDERVNKYVKWFDESVMLDEESFYRKHPQ